MTPRLYVHSPGILSTVQDAGRFGHEHQGVPPSGAMDAGALRIANVLVGNAADAPALEMTVQGGRFEVQGADCTLCVAGDAELLASATMGQPQRRLAPWQAHRLTPGTVLTVGVFSGGVRAYLAVTGGFAVPRVLGSASTLVRAGLGGLDGRALRRGDVLPVGKGRPPARRRRCPSAWQTRWQVALPDSAPIAVLLGPQQDHFAAEQVARFLGGSYRIGPQSDRMGYRLDGPAIGHLHGADIVSDPIAAGSIQIPGSGQPLVAMNDRQTTGGYPKIATVISADLPRLAQLRPGQTLRFEAVDLPTALARWRRYLGELNALERELRADPNFPLFPLLKAMPT